MPREIAPHPVIDSSQYTEWVRKIRLFSDSNYRQHLAYSKHAAILTKCDLELQSLKISTTTASAAAAVRIKRVMGITGVAYVSGGPLCKTALGRHEDYSVAYADACLQLKRIYSEEMSLILRVRPRPMPPEKLDEVKRKLTARGFEAIADAKANQTHLVDVTKDRASLRSSLKQKWRNCLNAAERAGLQIARRSDPGAFEHFHEIFDLTSESKGFRAEQDSRFFETVHQNSPSDEAFQVTYASLEGEVVGGHVGHIAGDTGVYLLGGTNQRGRDTKAGYLLQWDFMMQCMEQGCAWYDLGGVDPAGNAGVYRFKAGMGGIETPPACVFQYTPNCVPAKLLRALLRRKGI